MSPEQIFLLIINIILYLILLLINLTTRHAFNRKLEGYRTQNERTIALFRDELFKKNRRFELKFDIYKGLARKIPQIHWVITQFDWLRMTEAFENIWYQRVLVENFYGDEVRAKVKEIGEILNSIQQKRQKINQDLEAIFFEKMQIDWLKQRLNAILSTPPKNVGEIIERVAIDADINIKDQVNYNKLVDGIKRLTEEIQSSYAEVYPHCEQLLASMAMELKTEYGLEP